MPRGVVSPSVFSMGLACQNWLGFSLARACSAEPGPPIGYIGFVQAGIRPISA